MSNQISPWKWADGKLKVDGAKISVILKRRVHRALKSKAKEQGVSLSRYVEKLLIRHVQKAA